MIRRIHQFFFDFGAGMRLEDYPLFVQSRRAFSENRGWKYN